MRVVITGIAGRLAQLAAGVLAARPECAVSALGGPAEVPGVATLDADPRGAELTAALRDLAPDLVIHLAQPGEESPGERAGQLQAFDLLGACAAAGVGRVILRSSTLVYGAAPDSPAFFDESAPLRPSGAPSMQHDYIAIERFAAAQLERAPRPRIATLRMAPLLGPGLRTPLAAYLRGERPFTLRGFSPRIQALHIEDAVIAVALAALSPCDGPLNIAAADPIPLERAIRLAGRQPTPLPPAALSHARLTAKLTAPIRASLPFDPAFLQFDCVADTSRARATIGWEPRHTAAESIAALREESETHE